MATKKAKPNSTKKAVVRGPQKALPLREATRTPRLRYVEGPTKIQGNPFVAVRVPREMHAEFLKVCARQKQTPAQVLRSCIASMTGVSEPLEIEEG